MMILSETKQTNIWSIA